MILLHQLQSLYDRSCLVNKGVLRAFKGQLIHTFNKREGALSHAAGLKQLQGRPNVLLLGDSLGDLTMADGVTEHQNILTIGFLNDQVRLMYILYIMYYYINTEKKLCSHRPCPVSVSGGREKRVVHQLL